MKILLVKDDGYGAQGIVLVERLLQKYGEVFVVAPKHHQSGKGTSIDFNRPLGYEKIDDHHYILDSVPVNCTMFGLYGINQKFDLVVSGCNHGYNITLDTMYSGTIGACTQALFSRVPAIAFSCQFNYDMVEKHFDEVMEYILNNNLLSTSYLLNVNFPVGNKFKGIQITKQHTPKIDYSFTINEKEVRDDRTSVISNPKRGTDVYAKFHDYISITPLQINQFNEKYYKEVKNKVK